jgi:hypothetical protein
MKKGKDLPVGANFKPSRASLRRGEQSFTLIETIIALGLMVSVIVEVSGVQGHAIYFSDFERKVTKASWLAKGVMAKIEYEWDSRPFSEMKNLNSTEQEFETDKDYTYTVKIDEWKLPLLDLLTGGGGGDKDKDNANPQGDMIKGYIEKIFGDEILKIAHVEVFWADGAKKDSVALSTLLTNQQKLDEVISTMAPVKDAKAAGAPPKALPPGSAPPPPGSATGGTPGAGGIDESGGAAGAAGAAGTGAQDGSAGQEGQE